MSFPFSFHRFLKPEDLSVLFDFISKTDERFISASYGRPKKIDFKSFLNISLDAIGKTLDKDEKSIQ